MTTTADGMAQLAITHVDLIYPHAGTGEPALVAYASFRISDGAGFDLYVKSAKLMRDDRTGYFVQLPHEPRRAKCAKCRGRNPDHAPFCSWCGAGQPDAKERGYFYDVVVPANVATRAAILHALVDEHKRRN